MAKLPFIQKTEQEPGSEKGTLRRAFSLYSMFADTNRTASRFIKDKMDTENTIKVISLLSTLVDNTTGLKEKLDSLAKKDDNNSSMGLASLFRSLLLPALALGFGAFATETAKQIQTGFKVAKEAGTIVKAGKTGIEMAKTAYTAIKSGNAIKDTIKAAGGITDAIKSGSLIRNMLGNASDADENGNRRPGKFTKLLSGGMIAGRLAEGDYTGAALEGLSLGSQYVGGKYGKIAKGVGLALDGTIVARDLIRKDDKTAPTDASVPPVITSQGKIEQLPTTSDNHTEPQKESSSMLPGVIGAGVTAAALKAVKIVQSVPNIESSITRETAEVASRPFMKTMGGALVKGVAKNAGKFIPGVGLVVTGAFAANRVAEGDYTGALGEIASGLVGLVPVIGTAGAIAIQAGLAVRDYKKESESSIQRIDSATVNSAAVTEAGITKVTENSNKVVTDSLTKSSTDVTNNTSMVTKLTDAAIKSVQYSAFGLAGLFTSSLLGISSSSETLKKMHSSITDGTKVMFGLVTGTLLTNVKSTIATLKNFATDIASIAKNAVVNTMDALKKGAVSLFDSIRNSSVGQFVSNSVDKVTGFFGDDKATANPYQGKNVAALPNSKKYDNVAADEWKKNGVDSKLFPVLKAQIAAESGFNPNAKSKSGAFGLTQFMPGTAKQYGVQAGDSDTAVRSQLAGQAKYMSSLQKKYNGDVVLALMAYNWGPGNVDKWLAGGKKGPVPEETKNYIARILGNTNTFANDFGGFTPAVSTKTKLDASNPVKTDTKMMAPGAGVLKPKDAPKVADVKTDLSGKTPSIKVDGLPGAKGSSGGGGSTGSVASSVPVTTSAKSHPNETAAPAGAEPNFMALGMKAVRLKDNNVNMSQVNPGFRDKFYMMVGEFNSKTGKGIIVTEGFRTRAYQAMLKKKYPNKAAEPGLSMHEYGLAIDANSTELNEMDRLGLMRKYGFVRPYSKEPWHIEHSAIRDKRASYMSNDAAVSAKAASEISGQPVDPNASGPDGSNTPETSMSDSISAYGDDGNLNENWLQKTMTNIFGNDVNTQALTDFMKGGKVDAYDKNKGYKETAGIEFSKDTSGQIKPVFDRHDTHNGEMTDDLTRLTSFNDSLRQQADTSGVWNTPGFTGILETRQQADTSDVWGSTGFTGVLGTRQNGGTGKKNRFTNFLSKLFPNISGIVDSVKNGRYGDVLDQIGNGGLFGNIVSDVLGTDKVSYANDTGTETTNPDETNKPSVMSDIANMIGDFVVNRDSENAPSGKWLAASMAGAALKNAATSITDDPNATKTGFGGFINKSVIGLSNILNSDGIDTKEGRLDIGTKILSNGLGAISKGITDDPNSTKTGFGGLVNRGVVGLSKMAGNVIGDNRFSRESDIENIAPDYTPHIENGNVMEKVNTLSIENTKKMNSVNVVIPPTINPTPEINNTGNKSTGSVEGVNLPMNVRNNDSIIKSIAMEMMKASM